MTSEMAENGGRNDAEQSIQVQILRKTDLNSLQDTTSKMIPKFSSFKAPPKLADRSNEPAKGTKEDKSKRRHDDDRHHKHRHHRGDEDSSRSPSRHRDKRRRTVSPSPPPPARIESDIFKVDTKGDAANNTYVPANITYGISYRYSVRFSVDLEVAISLVGPKDGESIVTRERGRGLWWEFEGMTVINDGEGGLCLLWMRLEWGD